MTGLPPETFQRLGQTDAPRETAASSLSSPSPSPWFVNWATGDSAVDQPIYVNEFTALNYAALFTCVKLVSNTIAALPLKVYRRRADGGADEILDHPAARLLQREFNPNTSSFTGRQSQLGHLLTWGNSYTQIVRRRSGELLRLQPLGPDLVTPDTTDAGDLVYRVRDRDSARVYTLAREDVLHVPYYSFDAMVGLSVVRIARGLIRQGLGQDRQSERFVTSGMRSPGALRFREGAKFKSEAEAIQFRNRFRAIHNKADGDNEILILEDGAQWQQLGVDPESAQLLESRHFSRAEIAAVYGIPPNMIGEAIQTYNGTGVEELNIWFATYCLLPIAEAIEQEQNRKLFGLNEQDCYVKHELKGLLRGDTLKRSQALQVQMQSGIITVNEWRRLEGYNPVEGGDVRYFPLNMGRVDGEGDDLEPPPPAAAKPLPGAAPPTPPAPDTPSSRRAESLVDGMRKAILLAVSRCLRKEAAEATKAARKPGQFVAWLDEFYSRHAEMVRETVSPLVRSWQLAFAAGGPEDESGYAARHCERSRADLLAAAECPAAELESRVQKCVEKWNTERMSLILTELLHATV